jgi:hypothetical protein
MRHHRQRDDGRWNTAARQPPDHTPVDAARIAMHQAAAGLGRRGIEQIGADGGDRMHAEQQNQQRCHQRPAANAGHTDQHADNKARKRIQWVDQRIGSVEHASHHIPA